MKDLYEVFGEQEPEEITEVQLEEVRIVSNGTNQDIAHDYVIAREKIVTSIIRASEVLDTAVMEAKTAPSPRAIEAVSSIAKNLNDATENLMKLHEKFRNIERDENKKEEVSEESCNTIKTSLSSLLKEMSNNSSFN